MKGFVTESCMDILIVSTNEATIATISLRIGGIDHTWQGTAKKVSSDRYNASVGTKLALGRALAKASNQLLRQANGFVKSVDDNTRQSIESRTKKKPSKFTISKFRSKKLKRKLSSSRSSSNRNGQGSLMIESTPIVTHGPIS